MPPGPQTPAVQKRESGRPSRPAREAPARPAATAGPRRELLAAEVLDKAALLFATRGFAATSLKDVADAVGLQRSSIYYYYPNKDALLKELIQGVTLPVARIFQEVDAQALSPLARIREVVRRLVLWVTDPRTHFRLMDRSEAELPDVIAKMHGDAKRHVLKEMIRLIDAAVLAGEARASDARIGALSIIGMAMWTAWWVQPTAGREEVAEEVAANAAALIQRASPAKQGATVGELTREIRDTLAVIDRLAGRPDP